jgi:hypothetical protein
VSDQGPQPLPLVGEQPVARPPVPGELLAGQRPLALGLGRGAGGAAVVAGDMVVVVVDLVMGASPPRAYPCR